MKRLRVIDLFAGCGGLSDGFEQSEHYEVIAHVEWEKAPCLTLINRLKKKWGYTDAENRVIRFDIQRSKELLSGWKDDPEYASGSGLNKIVSDNGGVDLIIGGPPCQAYSLAGRIRDEHGMRYDYRNYLFESYLEVVKRFKPKVLIFENVPGILSAKPVGRRITDRITEAFINAGYELANNLKVKAKLDFTLYGIPQKRLRVILLGLKRSEYRDRCQKIISEFYDEILTQYCDTNIYDVQKTIGDLTPFYPAKSDYKINGRRYSHKPYKSDFLNHTPRYHNRRDIRIFNELALDIQSGTNKYISIDALKKLYSERTGKSSNVHKYYVLRWKEPSNTIPAHLYKDGLRHIHPDPEQFRSITVREGARLQTFDDDFEFLGSLGDQYKMVGNAVPPKFARKLGCAVFEMLQKYG